MYIREFLGIRDKMTRQLPIKKSGKLAFLYTGNTPSFLHWASCGNFMHIQLHHDSEVVILHSNNLKEMIYYCINCKVQWYIMQIR